MIKNKCTDCRSHLLKCDGVRADGQKAEDDPRIKALRVATLECADHLRAVKRGRTSSGLPNTGTVEVQEAHALARHDLETRLDTARAEKASSEAKVVDLEQRVRAMEEDMSAMKHFQSAIVGAAKTSTANSAIVCAARAGSRRGNKTRGQSRVLRWLSGAAQQLSGPRGPRYLFNAAIDSGAVSSTGSARVHSRAPQPDRPTRAALRTRRPARERIARTRWARRSSRSVRPASSRAARRW